MMSNTTMTTVESVEYHDPASIVVGANVRRVADLGEAFVASVAEHGVLEAVTAYRDAEGALILLRGQRRTLAAREASVSSIPVRVVPEPAAVERIGDQLTENVHRQTMRASDLTLAIQDLAELGESDAAIAQRLAIRKAEVEVRRAATRNADALAKLDAGALSFEHAAIIAQFEDDPEAVDALLACRSEWAAERKAAEIRRTRAEAQAWQDAAEAWRRDGWAVMPYGAIPAREGDGVLAVSAYVDVETGQPVQVDEDTPREALTVGLSAQWEVRTVETGDEDDEDGYDDDDDADVEEVLTWAGVVGVLDPDRLGWMSAARYRARHGALPAEAEAVARVEAEKESKREEGRRVRANNRAWDEAAPVRRKWISAFLKGKTPPAGAERFIARAVIEAPLLTREWASEGHPLLATTLDRGVKNAPWGRTIGKLDTRAAKATPKAATMLTVAALVATWETHTGRHTWRTPSDADKLVMAHLVAWGYDASEVERGIIG